MSNEVSDRLKRVIMRELELEDLEIGPETTAAQVPGWDSLRHIQILAAVEEEYAIRFRSLEIMRLKTIADLQGLIDSKQS